MAVLAVDEKGTSFSYTDSGPLENDKYVTLFLLHGHAFYSPVFNPLIPFSSKYNIRIVAITRRDYPGSTPFTLEELDLLAKADPYAKTRFLQDRAREIAIFLFKFTQQHNLPKASPDGTYGGIALLGWSLGNVQALSVVGFAQHLSKSLIDALEPYFRRLVVYESAHNSFGFPPPAKAYHPRKLPTTHIADPNEFFNTWVWVSGYYKHGDLTSRNPDNLEYVTPSRHRPATISTLSREELSSIMDTTPGPRSENQFSFGADPRVMSHIRDQVFFPDKVVWPRLKVKSVWCTETPWSVIYTAWELEKYVQEKSCKAKNQWQRPLVLTAVEGVNHFAHWDEPEKIMQVFSNVLST